MIGFVDVNLPIFTVRNEKTPYARRNGNVAGVAVFSFLYTVNVRVMDSRNSGGGSQIYY
jgi:hypothetical protein